MHIYEKSMWGVHQGTLESRGLCGVNTVGFKRDPIFIFASLSAEVLTDLCKTQTAKDNEPYEYQVRRGYVHEMALSLSRSENSPLLLCFISAEQLLEASVLKALEVSCWSSDRDHVVEGIWHNKITQVSQSEPLPAHTVESNWIWKKDTQTSKPIR